jgi:hypothetical protein
MEIVVLARGVEAEAKVKDKDQHAYRMAAIVPCLAMWATIGASAKQISSRMTLKAVILLEIMPLVQHMVPTDTHITTKPLSMTTTPNLLQP